MPEPLRPGLVGSRPWSSLRRSGSAAEADGRERARSLPTSGTLCHTVAALKEWSQYGPLWNPARCRGLAEALCLWV